MHLEVRTPNDLKRFENLAKQCNLLKVSYLQLEFFWNFQRFTSLEEETKSAEMLVDEILAAKAFRKLSIATDSLSSAYLPVRFLEILIREIGLRKTQIHQLCLDLNFINKLNYENGVFWSGGSPEDLTTNFVVDLGHMLAENTSVEGLVI